MADATLPTDTSAGSVCPWCSAALTPDATTCPSCGANLTADGEPDLPGVTAVDHTAIRGEKKPAGRNRLLSWISGEYPEDDTPLASEAQALAPPDPDVQREITRLALEAEVANLQAEQDAILSEAVMEGRVVDLPEGVQPFPTVRADDGGMPDETGATPGEIAAMPVESPDDTASAPSTADTDTTTQADPPA